MVKIASKVATAHLAALGRVLRVIVLYQLRRQARSMSASIDDSASSDSAKEPSATAQAPPQAPFSGVLSPQPSAGRYVTAGPLSAREIWENIVVLDRALLEVNPPRPYPLFATQGPAPAQGSKKTKASAESAL